MCFVNKIVVIIIICFYFKFYCGFSVVVEVDNNKPTTRYYKKSIPGTTGGLLILETGICQPFYYIKLCCVERSRLGNLTEDKPKSPVKKIFIKYLYSISKI